MSGALHVMPIGDQVEHTPDDDCACGPTATPVEAGDGSIGWLMVHHSLDAGRSRRVIAGLDDHGFMITIP